jgi:hypothetical protein
MIHISTLSLWSHLALVHDLKRTKHDIQIVVVARQVKRANLSQSVHAMVLEIYWKGFASATYNEQNRMRILRYYFAAPFFDTHFRREGHTPSVLNDPHRPW